MKTNEIITYTRKSSGDNLPKFYQIIAEGRGFAALAALMLSRGALLGNIIPFGLAWYAVNIHKDKHYLIFGATLLGTLFISEKSAVVYHIISLLLMLALKKGFPSLKWKSPTFLAACTTFCMLISETAASFFSGAFYYFLILSVIEAFAAGGMCLIFHKATGVIERDWNVLSGDESVSIAILAGCIVAGLQGIDILGIKPANVLSMYIILFTAYKGDIGISGGVGAALGIIAGMSQGDAPALTGVYGFMGIISGVMNVFGKVGVVISAAFANAIFTGYYNSSTIVLVNLIEILSAGLAFFFTPERALDYLKKFTMRAPVYDSAGGYIMRLKNSIGETLCSLKNSATAIAEAYAPCPKEKTPDEKALIKERLISRVCEGCSLNKYCWNRNVKGSNLMFEKISADCIKENFDEVTCHITGRCVRGDFLQETAKELCGILKREKIIKKRVDMYAKSFSEGWSDFLEIIKTKEEKIVTISPDYPSLEREFCRELAARGINSPKISIILNDCDRFEITLRTESEILFDIIPIANKVICRPMCISDEYKTKSGFVVKLQEKLKFDYDVSIITMNKEGSETSGDNGEWFVTPDGIFYCILCDGMGSGKKASEDSQQVIHLFKTLILSGFTPQSSLKIINGGMISSDKEETLVSFDCVSVDLFTGKADFIKAGAVASVIKTKSETSLIKESAIPLGVLDIESVPVKTIFLKGDSYIVLMTDGITDNIGDRKKGEECILNLMKLMEVSGSKEISDNIMMSAVAEGIPKDDMMVTAIKISEKD